MFVKRFWKMTQSVLQPSSNKLFQSEHFCILCQNYQHCYHLCILEINDCWVPAIKMCHFAIGLVTTVIGHRAVWVRWLKTMTLSPEDEEEKNDDKIIIIIAGLQLGFMMLYCIVSRFHIGVISYFWLAMFASSYHKCLYFYWTKYDFFSIPLWNKGLMVQLQVYCKPNNYRPQLNLFRSLFRDS